MFLLNGLLRQFAKRTRDRLIRGLKGDLAETRSELAATQARLDRVSAALATVCRELDAFRASNSEFVSSAVQTVRQELGAGIEQGVRANQALAANGYLVNLSPTERAGDGTLQGALGYPTWEGSVAAYRPAFQVAIDLLRSGQVYGPVLEFGTCTGFTARIICEMLVGRSFDVDFYMFDSFVGLPEVVGTPDETSYDVMHHKVWYKGAMSVPDKYEEHVWEVVTKIRPAEKLHMVKGFYEDTLDEHLPRQKCSLVHIDCDIYISAKYVLAKLAEKDLFQDGCVVMFDDWNCNRANPNMGERRALAEFLREYPRWSCSPWFPYGWNGHAFIFHDTHVTG